MIKEDNLEFLLSLDKKVHYITERVIKQGLIRRGHGMPLGSVKSIIHNFSDNKLTLKEIKQIIKILKEEDTIVIKPFSIHSLDDVGFDITYFDQQYPGIEPDIQELLTFKESQLPKGYNFQRISPILLSDKNLKLVNYFGLPQIREKEFYLY